MTAGTPAPPEAVLRRRSRAAVARATGADRALVLLVGLVLLAGGALAALVGRGVLGAGRAARPLLDPVLVAAVGAQPLVARLVAVAAGVLLVVVGLVRAVRALTPERRPDLVLDPGPALAITVSATAAAQAVTGLAEAVPGVGRARARLVGSAAAPALRVTVALTEDADVRDVLERLDRDVLAPVRASMGLAALPAAVRVELHPAASAPRVA